MEELLKKILEELKYQTKLAETMVEGMDAGRLKGYSGIILLCKKSYRLNKKIQSVIKRGKLWHRIIFSHNG